MKALSIRNPYADDIFCLEKRFEYRTWQTSYRGDFVVCSSANPKIKGTICGYALCVCRLNNIIKINKKNYKNLDFPYPPQDDEKIYAWELTNVRAIKPFKVKGKLNFFDVDDNLIEYFHDENNTPEEDMAILEKYFYPLQYKGKNQNKQ